MGLLHANYQFGMNAILISSIITEMAVIGMKGKVAAMATPIPNIWHTLAGLRLMD